MTVVTVPREGEGKEYEFSQTYACEEHGISFGELEPRMFSFNNPAGACPHCAGLGDIQSIAVERLIPNKELSLSEGAIAVNGFKSLEEESWNGPLFAAVGKIGRKMGKITRQRRERPPLARKTASTPHQRQVIPSSASVSSTARVAPASTASDKSESRPVTPAEKKERIQRTEKVFPSIDLSLHTLALFRQKPTLGREKLDIFVILCRNRG